MASSSSEALFWYFSYFEVQASGETPSVGEGYIAADAHSESPTLCDPTRHPRFQGLFSKGGGTCVGKILCYYSPVCSFIDLCLHTWSLHPDTGRAYEPINPNQTLQGNVHCSGRSIQYLWNIKISITQCVTLEQAAAITHACVRCGLDAYACLSGTDNLTEIYYINVKGLSKSGPARPMSNILVSNSLVRSTAFHFLCCVL